MSMGASKGTLVEACFQHGMVLKSEAKVFPIGSE